MQKKILFFFIIFLSFSLQALPQKGTIKGRVYNARNNEPLEFCSVGIQGTNIGSTSDLDGNFTFTGIDPGFVRLVVSYIGFETAVSSEIQVQGNQTVFIDIPVQEKTTELKEVVVRQPLDLKKIESPVSLLKIGVQEIEKGAGVNRDVSKSVQLLPGVGATDPNRNDLIVRGGGPSENVFYLDGVEIPVINHFATQGSSGGTVGVINPDFVSEVNFYTGAFPANRSNALSSVMDIKLRDGSRDKLQTKFNLGASDAGFTLDGPLGDKSTFIVSARQSYLQFLFDVIGLPFLPTYTDFQVKNKIKFDRKNELTFIGIGAIDDMVLNTTLENPTESQRYLLSYLPVYKQWNYTVGAVYRRFYESHFNTWVLSRNMLRNANFKYLDNDETKGKTSDYLSDEAENKLRFESNYPDLPVRLLFGGGIKYSRYTNDTYRKIFVNNAVSELTYNTKILLFGYQAFVQASDEYLDERLRLSFGLNVTGNNYNKVMANPLNQLSPRFSASYTISDKLDVNANVGRYVMQPSYTSLGYRNAAGVLVNQNENVRFTGSNHYIAGFGFSPREKVKLTVEGFFKTYDHYAISVAEGISLASKGTEYGQVGDEEIISNGEGRAFGLELLAKVMEMNGLNLTGTYTLFRSEFTDAQGVYRPSSWDTKHLFNFIASYKFGKSWNVATRWRFVGGAPYTPIDENLSSIKEVWNIRNQPYLDYDNYNSLRLRNSHILDLRIDKEFYFKKWVFNLYTDVQNVYNFKSENEPIYTNLDQNGLPVNNSSDPSKYILRRVESLGGTVLPTLGIIIKM